jgi:hypothetical protein
VIQRPDKNEILGMFIEGDKIVTLVKTLAIELALFKQGLSQKGYSICDLKHIEKEFPNLIHRYETSLTGE